MTNEQKCFSAGYNAGVKAFETDTFSCAAHCPIFLGLIEGDSTPLLKAWNTGYHRALKIESDAELARLK